MNERLKQLSALGQSIWIDSISRTTLRDGSLRALIADYGVTGLTSNPTLFEQAMAKGDAYDDAIARLAADGLSSEAIFFALAVEDLRAAADLFAPVHAATGGVDGWVSLELSPLLVKESQASIESARHLHAAAGRRNLFIKIPGTTDGLVAIEDAIYAGIPVNVTLLFSREQYLDAAAAYLRGIERRLVDGRPPVVESVASVFVSRWDAAIMPTAGPASRNRLGIAIASCVHEAYRDLLASPRWRELADAGAHPQRLLWASTGTKDPAVRETLYVDSLAAPATINTMPLKTLQAYAAHGEVRTPLMAHAGDADAVLEAIADDGIDVGQLAARLQQEAADAFATSWRALIAGIDRKVEALASQ